MSKKWQQLIEGSLGLDPALVEQLIVDDARRVADLVKRDFERVMAELQTDSISKTFEHYTVEIEEKPIVRSLPKSKRTLNLVEISIYVKSPYPDLNVFDILDAGRPALPARAPTQTAYPLWSLRASSLTSPTPRRNIRTGRFSMTQRTNIFGGIRPENKRQDLYKKPYDRGSVYRPVVWTRKGLPAITARSLYDRVLRQSLKKMRSSGLDGFRLVKAVRKSR